MNLMERLTTRIDQLIEMANEALRTERTNSHGYSWIDGAAMKGFRSAGLSFVQRVFGDGHVHYKEFNATTGVNNPEHARGGIAILNVIKSEIEGGWIFTLKGLVAAELFSDFIEMANHLLENGYKDPAAVIIGSVLEEHLRLLCKKNTIATEDTKNGKVIPRKADRLNAELAKAALYSALDQKTVTAWLDLRNKAAHGKYSEYNETQVQLMISGVTEFMARIAV